MRELEAHGGPTSRMGDIHDLLVKSVSRAARVAVLGCGSPLRGDDAAGVLVAQALSGAVGKCRAFVGDVAPENLTGEIKQYAPDLLLVVDAVEMGRKPGELAVIPLDLIGGVSFSTHMLPLSIVLDYLSREVGCEVLLVGVQLSSIEFMAAMHPAVAAAVAELIDGLKGMLADCQA